MSTPLSRLVALLDVEEIEVDLYRGANTDAGWERVYGGQVVAQALAAAQRDERIPRNTLQAMAGLWQRGMGYAQG